EDSAIGQLEFAFDLGAASVLFDEPPVWKLGLRIFVERFHVRMGGGRIQIEVILLDVFAVIALRSRHAEETLLDDRVAPVPERDGETKAPLPIGKTEKPVFSPSVGSASRVVVRKVVPRRSVGGVILPNCSPLPLREVRTPPLPVSLAASVLLESPC